MDADIRIHEPDTLWNLLRALDRNPQAVVAVDRPCKNLQFSPRPTLWQRLSLAAGPCSVFASGRPLKTTISSAQGAPDTFPAAGVYIRLLILTSREAQFEGKNEHP